uniref:Uncharacterized protein n=1 Tax=Peronospora matthiolae TaxID=2874970 RepID=A0AAV1VIL8_9STRA
MHATADMAGTPDRNLMEGGSHAGEAGNSYLEGERYHRSSSLSCFSTTDKVMREDSHLHVLQTELTVTGHPEACTGDSTSYLF